MGDYKVTRLKEIRHIIWAEYNHLFEDNELILAHLYQECPMLTWDCGYKQGQRRNDRGWAVGMAQWHIPSRHAQWMTDNGYYWHYNYEYTNNVRIHFFRDYPKMKEWRYQVRRYLDEITVLKSRLGIKAAILEWNRGAGWPYVEKVQNNVLLIRRMVE